MKDNPPDAFFKLVFSQPEHAAGELRFLLPPDISARIDWESLVHRPGSFVDEESEIAQSHSDLLFSVLLDGSTVLLYLVFEHPSTRRPLGPFRMLRYQVRIWESWSQGYSDAKKLPPILPLLLHQSESGWHGAVRFEEVLDIRPDALELLAPFVPHFGLVVDDISKTTDEALRRRGMTALGTVALWSLRDAGKHGVLARDFRRFGDLIGEIWSGPNGYPAMRAFVRVASPEEYLMEVLAELTDEINLREGVPSTCREAFEQRQREAFERPLRFLGGRRCQEASREADREGTLLGYRQTLLRQLRSRFGELPASAVVRVEGADLPTLEGWTDRLLTALTLDDVWAAPVK